MPLKCLDVLLTPKVRPGSLEYMGVNMDAVSILLDFLERRLDRVSCEAPLEKVGVSAEAKLLWLVGVKQYLSIGKVTVTALWAAGTETG